MDLWKALQQRLGDLLGSTEKVEAGVREAQKEGCGH